jgi:hypothetical protein
MRTLPLVPRVRLIKSFVHGLANKILFRSKMEIKAAMREARGLHQIGDTNSFETLLAKVLRCFLENALARRIHMSLCVTQSLDPRAA